MSCEEGSNGGLTGKSGSNSTTSLDDLLNNPTEIESEQESEETNEEEQSESNEQTQTEFFLNENNICVNDEGEVGFNENQTALDSLECLDFSNTEMPEVDLESINITGINLKGAFIPSSIKLTKKIIISNRIQIDSTTVFENRPNFLTRFAAKLERKLERAESKIEKINSRLDRLTLHIDKLQEKIDSGIYSEEKIIKIQERINKKKSRIDFLNEKKNKKLNLINYCETSLQGLTVN